MVDMKNGGTKIIIEQEPKEDDDDLPDCSECPSGDFFSVNHTSNDQIHPISIKYNPFES